MVCLIVNGDSLPHVDALVERLRTIQGDGEHYIKHQP